MEYQKGKRYQATGDVTITTTWTALYTLVVQQGKGKASINGTKYNGPLTLEEGTTVRLAINANPEKYVVEVVQGLSPLDPPEANGWKITGNASLRIRWKEKYHLVVEGGKDRVKVNGKAYDPAALHIEGSKIKLDIDAEPHEYEVKVEKGLQPLDPTEKNA